MSWITFYNSIVIPLCFGSGLWIPAMAACCIPWVQKQMLYLHWVTLWPGRWLMEPERAGFLKNQVATFTIPTADNKSLFVWLIAPLGAYAQHTASFIDEKPTGLADIEHKTAFKLLHSDPEARLLIYFHGNTATIAQGRRTEEYRMYSSGSSSKIYVLAFDYRGFGNSTGSPSEAGLLADSEAVLDWAMKVAGIPAHRIVLLGHSLGTAVATGITARFAEADPQVQFAGLILCAPFTNAGNAFSSYSIGNVIPLLAPVKMIPALQRWFSRRMRDTWQTDMRLSWMAKHCNGFRLTLVHAEDDGTLPWDMSERLFRSTLLAATEDASPQLDIVDLGEAGRQEIWKEGGRGRSITKLIARHGDHNTMMKWAPISLAILEAFELVDLSM